LDRPGVVAGGGPRPVPRKPRAGARDTGHGDEHQEGERGKSARDARVSTRRHGTLPRMPEAGWATLNRARPGCQRNISVGRRSPTRSAYWTNTVASFGVVLTAGHTGRNPSFDLGLPPPHPVRGELVRGRRL